MNNNTTALTYSGETFNYREVKEMSTRIASSVNSEIAKQLKVVRFSAITKSSAEKASRKAKWFSLLMLAVCYTDPCCKLFSVGVFLIEKTTLTIQQWSHFDVD